MLEQQMKAVDIDATRQLLAESAAAAAAGAATAAVVQHLKVDCISFVEMQNGSTN